MSDIEGFIEMQRGMRKKSASLDLMRDAELRVTGKFFCMNCRISKPADLRVVRRAINGKRFSVCKPCVEKRKKIDAQRSRT